MTDEEAADLVKRVQELERSNEALWAWVKALANQDTMVLEFVVRHLDRSEDSASESQKIIDHITDNAFYLHNHSLGNTDE